MFVCETTFQPGRGYFPSTQKKFIETSLFHSFPPPKPPLITFLLPKEPQSPVTLKAPSEFPILLNLKKQVTLHFLTIYAIILSEKNEKNERTKINFQTDFPAPNKLSGDLMTLADISLFPTNLAQKSDPAQNKTTRLLPRCPHGHLQFLQNKTDSCSLFFPSFLSFIEQADLKTGRNDLYSMSPTFPRCAKGHRKFFGQQGDYCRLPDLQQIAATKLEEKGTVLERGFLFSPIPMSANSSMPEPVWSMFAERETTEHLVLRLRGGKTQVPKDLIPRIDFVLSEKGPSDGVLDLLQLQTLFQTNDPSLRDADHFLLIDMTRDEISKKSLSSFLECFAQSEVGKNLTLIYAMRTLNIARDPKIILKLDTSHHLNLLKPFTHSANLHLSPKSAFLVCTASKNQRGIFSSKIFYEKGITTRPTDGGNKVLVEITTITDQGKNHLEAFRELFSSQSHVQGVIPCGKAQLEQKAMLKWLSVCEKSKILELKSRSKESIKKTNPLWISEMHLFESSEKDFDFLSLSFFEKKPKNEVTLLLSEAALKAADEKQTRIYALTPSDPVSLLVIVDKNSFPFYSSLALSDIRIKILTQTGAQDITRSQKNALVVYPVSAKEALPLSLEELLPLLRTIFRQEKIEIRRKGLRVHCSPETLNTWRTFEGFISFQKVRMCKENENAEQRKSWWGGLREEERALVNEQRMRALSRFEEESEPKVKKRKAGDQGVPNSAEEAIERLPAQSSPASAGLRPPLTFPSPVFPPEPSAPPTATGTTTPQLAPFPTPFCSPVKMEQ